MIRIQIQPGTGPLQVKYHSLIQALVTVAREEGLRGLYKGNMPAAYLYLSYGAAQFMAYHELDKATASLVRTA